MKNKMHFRAWLVDSSPEIWRELILDPRLTLEQLHLVMQVSFGWENCHMHQFHEEDGTRYGRPLPRKDAWGEELTDERKVQLSVAFPIPGKRIAYEYDFGDSWVHGIEFMGMIDPEQAAYEPHTFVERGRSSFTGKERAAICSRGERNGPPEDCGGIWGLDELIKLRDRAATKKRLSADDRERLEWLGNWNPEWLDLATINQNLAPIRVKKAMMR